MLTRPDYSLCPFLLAPQPDDLSRMARCVPALAALALTPHPLARVLGTRSRPSHQPVTRKRRSWRSWEAAMTSGFGKCRWHRWSGSKPSGGC
jgi:hypothetical protein